MFQKYFVKIYLRVGIEEGVGIWVFVTVQTERDLDGSTAFFFLYYGVFLSPWRMTVDCPSTTHSHCLNHDFKMAFQTL